MPILRNRRYLPHLEAPNSTYFVTFRLADSIPRQRLEDWKFERSEIIQRAERQRRALTEHETRRLKYLFSSKTERYLDRLEGECWLRNSIIAGLVQDALMFFNRKRYVLYAWCIMPNHVHVVFKTISTNGDFYSDLVPILHSWKSFTAHKANKILQRQGMFWQDEYYDRLIRSDEELGHCIDYTLRNPVNARLCPKWQDWPWSGCSGEVYLLLSS